MPTESQAMRRAMFAAKEGHSTLGIPKKVGAKFIAADKKRSLKSLRAMPERKSPKSAAELATRRQAF